ncbi:MAG: serine hydrolase domain-containing protein [Cyclobacteriaceae bacterium]
MLNPYVNDNGPGFAVGVVQDGRIVYTRYAGHANLDHMVPVDSLTRFNIASNTKQYIAMMVLELANEQKLGLNDDFRDYLPAYLQDYSGTITINNLLTHTSGIRDVYDLWSLQGKTWWQMFINNEDALSLIKHQRELNFAPGSEYLYSNSNYILLTALIEKVSGQSVDEYATVFFTKLAMVHTGFLTNYMTVIEHKARPYGNWNGWLEYPSVATIYGDGGLFTTLPDQLAYEAVLQNKAINDILPEEVVRMSQSQPLADITYGYGIMHDTYKGKDYLYHDGNTGAYNATFFRFPEEKLSVVVMANDGNVPTNYLARMLSDKWLSLSSDIQQYPAGPAKVGKSIPNSQLTGVYLTDGGTYIQITEKDGEIYRHIYGQQPVKLVNEEGNLFYYKTNKDLKIAFEKKEDDQRAFTIYIASQAPIEAHSVPDFSTSPAYLLSLYGTYINAETNTEITLGSAEGSADSSAVSIIKNGNEQKGELAMSDLILMNEYQMRVVRDDKGKVNSLSVDSNRIRNVRFEKR